MISCPRDRDRASNCTFGNLHFVTLMKADSDVDGQSSHHGGDLLELNDLFQRLEEVTTQAELQSVIVDLRDKLGVAHVLYHWVAAVPGNDGLLQDLGKITDEGYRGQQYGCGTYDPVWVQRYLEKGYLQIDPVVQGCYQRFHPVDWRRLDWSSKAARALAEDSFAYGVGNQGFSIPLRGPNGQFALFSISHTCDDATWESFTETHRRELILFAHYVNQKALELEPTRKPKPSQPLSPREIEALTLLAIGYSRAQAANTLSISEHTLRVYIESARFKLGAQNTTHAVARALSQGLIVV